MTSEAKWDPCIYDDSHLSTNAHLARLPSTSVEATDRFYNHYGDHIQSYKSLTWSPSSEDTVKVPNKLEARMDHPKLTLSRPLATGP